MQISKADRELMETDSKEYFDELALDDYLIELWQATQEKSNRENDEALALVLAGNEEIF